MSMDTLTLTAKEQALQAEGEKILSTAQAEGRKLTEEEETRFAAIGKDLEECRSNKAAIQARLDAFSKRANTVDVKVGDERGGRFSLLETINGIVNSRAMSPEAVKVLETGRKQMAASGQSYSGQIQMPIDTRALDGVLTGGNLYQSNTHNGGKEAVRTDVLDIVTGLRGASVLAAAGTTYMTGLVGNVEIPIYSGSTVGWGTEVANAQNGTGTFGAKTLTPKRLTAYIDVSKQFLIQTADTAEAMLRADIINALTAEVEKALLTTTAVSNAPAPIATTDTDITTAADWWSLIATLEAANYYGDFRVVLSPSLKASLHDIKIDSGSGRLLYDAGYLDGYPVLTSTNCASGLGFVGVWPELIVGQWGAVDITVDQYTQAAAGKVRIVVNAYFDAVLRRAGAIQAFEYKAPAAAGGEG